MAAIGAIAAVMTPVIWLAVRPAPSAGDFAGVEEGLRAAVAAPTVAPAVDDLWTSSGTTATTTSVAPSLRFTVSPPTSEVVAPLPVGLRIDDIEVEAPVAPYGVNRRTGEMDVPGNVREVAWYQFGPSPGQPGSAVLAAHVDLESQGPGIFFRLDTLDPGDIVVVEYDDGSIQEFRVEARVRYDKTALPLDVIFANDGPPVLTLITCGGGFNPSIRSYDSNVVVYAYPVREELS